MSLSIEDRRKARALARECWIDAEGDQERAEKLFNERAPKKYGIDPATILLFLQIALMVWKWWKERKIARPAEIPFGDEPLAGE